PPGPTEAITSVVNVFPNNSPFTIFPRGGGLGFAAILFIPPAAAVFVSVAGNDYHLASASPAIDAGITLAQLTADLEGQARPQRAGFDIGAYEAPGGPSPTPAASASGTPTRSPTPSATRTATLPSAIPTSTASATSTPAANTVSLSGQLRYYANSVPVAGATVRLQGATTGTQQTDPNGMFSFTDLPSGSLQITPEKVEDLGGGISALDAAYVLQALV